jgi:hypothetical protein
MDDCSSGYLPWPVDPATAPVPRPRGGSSKVTASMKLWCRLTRLVIVIGGACLLIMEGTTSGVYSFDDLRRDCPCASCDDAEAGRTGGGLSVLTGPVLRRGRRRLPIITRSGGMPSILRGTTGTTPGSIRTNRFGPSVPATNAGREAHHGKARHPSASNAWRARPCSGQ